MYAAAGGSGSGVFEAAKETGQAPGDVWAIGVDCDQYHPVDADLQPYILTSMLKQVDVAMYETIARPSSTASSTGGDERCST